MNILLPPPLYTNDCQDEQHEKCSGGFWDTAPCHCICHIFSSEGVTAYREIPVDVKAPNPSSLQQPLRGGAPKQGGCPRTGNGLALTVTRWDALDVLFEGEIYGRKTKARKRPDALMPLL